jgi:hypothetical protein
MTSNPEPIVQQLQDEFQNLLAYVTGPDARAQTAYSVESTLFRRLLALGGGAVAAVFCDACDRAPSRARHRSRWDAPDLSRSAPDDLLFGLWQSTLWAAFLHGSWA